MNSDAQQQFSTMTARHPGELILDYLEFHDWSQQDLARRTGITAKTISKICNGKGPITPSTAIALEPVFQRPARYWLNAQRNYDEFVARESAREKQARWSAWAKDFPLGDMRKLGFVNETNTEALLEYFGVSSPESWQAVWEASPVHYRRFHSGSTRQAAVTAWLRATEIIAKERDVRPFDANSLQSCIPRLRAQTSRRIEDGIPESINICASVGVVLAIVPQLKGTGISGCARWLSPSKALVGLSDRYKTDDQFWFTFFHEVGHLLMHRSIGAVIVDNTEDDSGVADGAVDPEMQSIEEEANRFASDTLIPPHALSAFIKTGAFKRNDPIKRFAEEIGVSPGIVVGRLQREGLLAHHQGTKLKQVFSVRFG